MQVSSLRSLRLGLVALACAAALPLTAPSDALAKDSTAQSADGTLLAQRSRSRNKKKRGKATTEPTPAAEPAPTTEPADADKSADAAKPVDAAKPAEPSDGKASAAPATPATTPASESTTPEVASSAELVDVDALRQEYLQLRDELFKSRARASTISSQLYSTKVTIRFSFASGRHYGVNKATIRLDGASVFEDTEGAIASDDAVRFEGFVAPGRHVLTFRLEVTGKDDDRFTSANEAEVALQAVAGKDLVVTAKAKDGGDIAYAWKRGEKGSYGLGLDISVKAQKRAAPTKAAKVERVGGGRVADLTAKPQGAAEARP